MRHTLHLSGTAVGREQLNAPENLGANFGRTPMEGSLSSVRTYVVHLYDPEARNYTTQELHDITHDEAIAAARALAQRRRVDLWLGKTKVGSFPRQRR
jgi:hypothetical protein